VFIILLALFSALIAIFSPALVKLRHPTQPVTRWLNLNPGIDISGGTSLLYEIRKPEGGAAGDTNLAEKVMIALKRRIDPDGVRNLIWRPQGNDRLEIQMPFSGNTRANTENRAKIAEELSAARAQLEGTNIAPQDVIDAVEQNNGHTQAELKKLADGDPARADYFAKLVAAWNQVQAAHTQRDADLEARRRAEYQKLLSPSGDDADLSVSPIQATNLRSSDVDDALTSSEPGNSVAAIRAKFADFPDRMAAIDRYVAASDAESQVKNSLDSSEDIKRLLHGSGVLEFHIVVQRGDLDAGGQAEYLKMLHRLEAQGPRVEAGDTMRWYEVDKPDNVKTGMVPYNGKYYVLLWTTLDKTLDHRIGQPQWELKDASRGSGQNGEAVVAFRFDAAGGQLFGVMTGNNIGHPMAVVLSDKVINVATIQSRISDSGQIDGGSSGFSESELDYLVNTMTAGSLPAQLADEPISERTVGSTIGEDNLKHGLVACGLGLVVVAVFLIGYYYVAGVVATFAVLMNVVLILGTMAAINATFTLPSIAGIVLTIGTAVDANVLIFERLREEQKRGLSLRMALKNAYGKAFSAIVDSNMTTVITSLALIFFGTEEVKGFGITLIIGIVASLFTALFVTRTIFGIMIERFGVKQLSSLPLTFPKWDRLLHPKIDWMRMVWGFVTFSVIAITVGMVMFVNKARAGEMLDIEFASGTSVQFELKQPMKIEDVRKLIERAAPNVLPTPSVVSVDSGGGTPDTIYEVITPNANSTQVKDAVLSAVSDKLKAVLPSKFDSSSAPITDALKSGAVRPITADALTNAGAWPQSFVPPKARDYLGGVAIVLSHIEPRLSAKTINDRIVEQQLQADTSPLAAQREFTVEAPPAGPDGLTSVAVILARNESIPYEKDAAAWESQLADPMWKLTTAAIGRPPQLQQVRNFDAAVAGDTQQDAFLALGASILAIMAYIWVRFGNLKYGTATVVALVHDTIFTIAALGFAHYLVQVPFLRDALALEPFRINLTVVAGILTIMGYSMIDTIVVFDRIRENRGKYGLVSRQVINDAVNQTLSRTLLTAGTTTVTVTIMYFFGGPGIHGFTFVLLVGILVGTYSSVAIAAPILLLGNQPGPDAQSGRPGVPGPDAQSGRNTAKLQRAGA
jgi:SecD/SecF fusion protein